MSFPCTVALSSYSDLLVLERTIRELLQCQNPACAFLQSAVYKRLKFAITRSLSQPGAPLDEDAETVIHIPHSQLVMYVSDDFRTVLIQSKAAVYLEAPVKRKGADGEPSKRRKVDYVAVEDEVGSNVANESALAAGLATT
jgi:hypothetical protein